MKNNEQLPFFQNNDVNSVIKLTENEQKNLNIQPQNFSNLNQANLIDQDKENEELDDTENLRFKGNNSNWNAFLKQRLDSCDSTPAQYKFSIDLPNVPKQRLHEYLNDDLLNALDVSPNIPNLNSGLSNNKKLSISNENNNNNPNNLYGFDLYPQMADNKNKNLEINQINNNKNNLSDFNNHNMNNMNNINNMNYNLGNTNNFNNYMNYNYINNASLNYNINNPQIYVPTKFRNKDQIGEKNKQFNLYQNPKKEEQNNGKNKFDGGNKKNNQNSKKEGKNKKHFEVRAGDWTCSKCNNLNFSFRNKCNRCGLPKELNNRYEPMNPEIFNQNENYQLMNGMNSNLIYGNNINDININLNNVKFYPK
jgi:hypothetical protein